MHSTSNINGLTWVWFHAKGRAAAGYIPSFLDVDRSAKARDQLDYAYQHGGGWRPFPGFQLIEDSDVPRIQYPDDPPYSPLAFTKLRDEVIIIYPHSWVMIMQPDRSFEMCRMD